MNLRFMSDSKIFKVAFFISGRGRLARKACELSKELKFSPVLFFLDEKADPELEQLASEGEFDCVRSDFRDRESFNASMLAASKRARPDLILLTFDKLVPAALIEEFPNRIVNLHMSLLPAFRGFGALRAAMQMGVGYVGASMHLVNEGVDDGALLAQCAVGLNPAWNEDQVAAALGPELVAMYLQTLAWFRDARVNLPSEGRISIRSARYEFARVIPNIEPEITALLKVNCS